MTMSQETTTPIPERFALYALWQTEHVMRLAVDAGLARFGLSLPQFAALAWLEHEPGLSTADLARLNRVSPQNMGAAVARLCSVGYVERTPPRHGRVAELRLTERGWQALRAAAERVAAAEAQMLVRLSDAERDALPDLLRRCRAGFADPT